MRIYRVYVIEVVPAQRGRFLYVGQTALSLHARLAQHAGGKRYCQSCTKRRYVIGAQGTKLRLRTDLAGLIGRSRFRKRPDAERAERWLARELRHKGYRVQGGH